MHNGSNGVKGSIVLHWDTLQVSYHGNIEGHQKVSPARDTTVLHWDNEASYHVNIEGHILSQKVGSIVLHWDNFKCATMSTLRESVNFEGSTVCPNFSDTLRDTTLSQKERPTVSHDDTEKCLLSTFIFLLDGL